MTQDTSFNHGHVRTVAGSQMQNVDEFLDHRTRDRSSDDIIKSKDWHDLGKLDVWLHMRAPISAVWSHPMWRIFDGKVDGSDKRVKMVGFNKWGCHEDEKSVLKKQHKRRPDGSRLFPPQRCPQCKIDELVREMVVRGELRWTDPVLKFEGEDRSKTVIIRAGDFWGAFGSKDLDDDEIAEVLRTGAPTKPNAWKTAMPAKCSYVYVVVDNAHVADGAKIVVEGDALGRKMQKAIRDEMERNSSRDLGDPWKNPYLFGWRYDDAKQFADKYDVKVLGTKPSDEVFAAIRDADPPDTSDQIARGDVDELRTIYETFLVPGVKLQLDKAFPPRMAGTKPAAAATPPPATQAATGAPAPAAAAAAVTKPPAELCECDHCGEKCLSASDMTCPKCGAGYVMNGEYPVLATRPCLSCKAQVALPGSGAPGKIGDRAKCGACGAEHFETKVDEQTFTWAIVEAPKEQPRVRGKR